MKCLYLRVQAFLICGTKVFGDTSECANTGLFAPFLFVCRKTIIPMKTLGFIMVIIMVACLIIFLSATNNWDKKKEYGETIVHSKSENSIAKFLFYLFIGAFIIFNLIEMKNCSGSNNIPFEETIRHK